MKEDQSQILELLKKMHIFGSLQDNQLYEAARFFTVEDRKAGDQIYLQGEKADSFRILLDGEVALNWLVKENSTQMEVLIKGDFLGHVSSLYNRPESETATVVVPTRFLKANWDRFHALLDQYPDVQNNLEKFIHSRDFAEKHRFDWITEGELIYQVRRKHWFFLFLSLVGPLLIFCAALVALIAAFWNREWSPVFEFSSIAALGLFLISLAWGIWAWVDWSNDFYIVTTQRVAWIEKVMWLYESRIEAPLNTIMSIDMNTSFWGRMLGYGNVIISTFTGKIIFHNISDPRQVVDLVEEYWHRAQQIHKRAENKEMEKAVLRAIGQEEPHQEEITSAQSPSPSAPGGYEELSVKRKYFSSIFVLRIERGNTITYRKHWIILFRKTLVPLVIGFISVLGLAAYLLAYSDGYLQLVSPISVSATWFVLTIALVFPWWLYNYIDWRNDIYQVTDRNIFDITRKPLGTEIRKSASLENVLSLEHERPGLTGYLLNFGNVIINIGEVKFIFYGVHEPARIQRDIFNRMHLMRLQKQETEAASERERIIDLLSVYHQNLGQTGNARPDGENYR